MTSITLLAVAFCLCVVPSLGSYYYRQTQGYPPRYPGFRQPEFPRRESYPPRQTYGYENRYDQGENEKAAGGRDNQEGPRQRADGGRRRGQSGDNAQGPDKAKPAGFKNNSPNPPDAVAFSGNRKTTQYFFQPGPVIFDDVTTNIGGAYNSDYGVFTAFEAGIYQVSYNVVSPREGKKTAAVDLLRNKEVINSASGSGPSGETSNSAVVFLDRWDQLSVQGRAESAVYCGEGGDDAFCSFNVALLKLGNFVDNEKARKVPGW